jgi:hypothetical protein
MRPRAGDKSRALPAPTLALPSPSQEGEGNSQIGGRRVCHAVAFS